MKAPVLITEHGLEDFRRRFLSPEAVLGLVERHVRALLRLGIGVGKSVSADALLQSALLYERFGFVVYAAPTWSILRERQAVRDPSTVPVPSMVLRPRPKERCGDYAEPWARFEAHSCSTYAKGTLCRQCQATDAGAMPCEWPSQFAKIKEHRLLFCTEQQLVLNRAMVPMVRSIAGVQRILVILDEARLLDHDFEVTIEAEQLHAFRIALESTGGLQGKQRWLDEVDRILAWRAPESLRLDRPHALHRAAFNIQKAGVEQLGDDFHYLGYDLSLLATSRPEERWIEGSQLRFLGRPFLRCHVLVLSAHLSSDYAGERLGDGPMESPFEGTVFRHTGSRVINLRSRIGADVYFRGNHRQILDTVAVLIARNIGEGRSTLLISRKKSKPLCARYLVRRLAEWGLRVRVVTEDYASLPATPDPRVVPVLHYGILGVNDFEAYESAYCVNGYYISSKDLSRAAQDATPRGERVEISIDSSRDMIRRARVEKGPDPGGVIANTANIYLRKLENDPVIQAVGRVRFLTRPREVVFMQMADLQPHVGPHEVVGSLAALRAALGIPSARDLEADFQCRRIRAAIDGGATAEKVAEQMGVSLSTVRRRLRRGEGVNFPLSTIRRVSDTPGSVGGMR